MSHEMGNSTKVGPARLSIVRSRTDKCVLPVITKLPDDTIYTIQQDELKQVRYK